MQTAQLVAIRKWLLDRAEQEWLSFDKVDFDQETDEILQGYVKSDDRVEDETRNQCWQLLQVWQRDREFLASLKLHSIIARHVRNSCRKAHISPSIESWVGLKLLSPGLDGLANEIENAIRTAWKEQSRRSADDVPKFSDKLELDEDLDKFHRGLEYIIGYPPTNQDPLVLMKREHEQGEPFQDKKYRDVDPKVEWNIVMGCESRNITTASCKPPFEIEKRVIGKPLDYYVEEARKRFSAARAFGAKALEEAEVAALRLWTGPMHKEYARVLRNPTKPRGPYVTTLHALNSGITKLARIWPLPSGRKVYRGYHNLSVKEFKKDAFQCVGGVEKSVLAASELFGIAVQYSGNSAFILEMEVGQVNRGADVSWLSQFPHEQEILFNALSNLEFICSPQLRFVKGHGTVLVYQVCLSANLKSKTLEEFVGLRKNLHLNLVDVLTQEVRGMIDMREQNSTYGVIKNLCAECREQCKFIFKEAGESDVIIFNQGAPVYVALVEDAILLRSRALEIIDLAVDWFENKEVDPSKLDRLQDWQLEALRTAFRSCDGPEVRIIVLEQVRVVNSLFTAESLDLGEVHKPEMACRTAKVLSLNPNLKMLKMKIASGTAEVWEQVFKQLCPVRPRLRVNGFFPAEYAAVSSLRQLELRNLHIQEAAMIAPALEFHPPSALTSLSLWGSPIGCTGAESLGRAISNLQKLRHLDLRSCQIEDRGCTGISLCLSALTDLEDLNLAHNNVKDDGFNFLVTNISRVASGLPRLKSVDMRCNDTQLPSLRCGPQCVVLNHILHWISTNVTVALATFDRFGRPQGSKLDRFQAAGVAWSPGGDQIASASDDNTIIIWDAKTGEQISTLKGHTSAVTSVAWRPGSPGHSGGNHIASGSRDRDSTIIIWDAKTGKQISTLKGHSGDVTSVAWRPGSPGHLGNEFASGSRDNTVIIWDAKTWEQVSTLKGHTHTVTSVAWRPRGDRIASASWDKTVIIWNAKTGKQVSTLKGHRHMVNSVAWCPGGDQIVSGGYGGRGHWSEPGEIIIWDAKTGSQVSSLKGHTAAVNSVAWRPGGNQIVSGGYGFGDEEDDENDSGEIIVWDAKTGDQVSVLKGHTKGVISVACRPGDFRPGDQIASMSRDYTMIIWDARTEEQVSTLKGHTNLVTSMDWRPGGDQIASGSRDQTIIIWDAKTGERISTLKGHTQYVRGVAWSPSGNQIASGSQDQTIIIWDAKSGEQISTLKGENFVTSVAWRPGSPGHPGGNHIASGSRDSTIIIWDAKTGKQISTLKGHSRDVRSVAWSPNGDQIASGSEDKTIIIWDAKSVEQISTLKGHANYVTSVAWRPGSPGHPGGGDRIASGSCDKTIIIWDAKTWEKISTLKGHSKDVFSVAWRPGGDQIVSGSADKTIIIWDAKTGEQVSTLKGHTHYVTSVACHPGGDQIASASEDKTVIVWDAKTGEQISMLDGHTSDVTTIAGHASVAGQGEIVGAAIQLSCADKCAYIDAGCQPPPPKKKKTHHRESQA